MPLPSEIVYNSLNGEEVLAILSARVIDVLNQVSEFKRHITFPRVRMVLTVQLDVHGRTPAILRLDDDVVVISRHVDAPSAADFSEVLDISVEINGDDLSETGQAPDELRETHGLPTVQVRRGAGGQLEDTPHFARNVGGIKYAAFVDLDYGPARSRTGEPIIPLKGGSKGSDIPLDLSKTPLGRR